MDFLKVRQFILENYKAVFFLLMIPYIYFYFNYPLYDIDSGWFAEPAYTWLNGGPMAMPSWPGVNGMDTHTYWFPPMIFWLQIPIYFLLGFGLLQDNILLLSIFLIVAGMTYVVAKKIYGEKVAKITFLLLLSSPLYSTFALYGNRSDVLVGVFNLAAIFFFFRSEKNEKYLYLCGIFGGLSVSSHLVGLLIAPAIGLVLVYQHRKEITILIRKEAKILVGFIAGILPWMMYASEDFALFTNQLYSNSKGDFIVSLLTEWTRISGLFLHKSMLFVAPILLLALYFGVKSRNRTDRILVFLVLFHIFVLLFVSHKSPRYYSSVLPIWFMLSARMMHGFFESKKAVVKKASSMFFLVVFIFSLFSYVALFVLMLHSNNYLSLGAYMSDKYLDDSRDRAFLAQPAYFFIFGEKMYGYNTIYWRAGMYNESFEYLINMTDPDYVFYGSHMRLFTEGAKDGIALDFMNFIENNTDEVETICFIGDHRVLSDKYLRRQNHNYFDLLMKILFDRNMCIDPVTIYKVR